VREWRLAAGLSQRELAARTKMTQPAIAAVEGGAHDPRLTTLRKIAGALGRSCRQLICGAQAPAPPRVSRVQARVRQVMESNNTAAMAVLKKGLETAERAVSSKAESGLPRSRVTADAHRIVAAPVAMPHRLVNGSGRNNFRAASDA
jgi:transcriptional regulator with XRE-family HTH domain